MNGWMRRVWCMGSVAATILLAPAVALADNCSGVYDCWGSAIRCALATAAGVGSLPFWDKIFGNGEDTTSGDPDAPPPEGGDDSMDDPCTS
jgi:hypothetical protein